ncbi:hypothetical protein [Streptomyces sp. NPDC005930]|uniref:hypothetical protein n=1 Tax=Streptomyces sp. NPDC005930 TaxID=3364736 RepID=UPI0036991C36
MSGATDTSVQMDRRRMARRAMGAVHQPRGGHGAGCGYFCLFDVSGKDLHIGQRQTSRDEPLVHGLKAPEVTIAHPSRGKVAKSAAALLIGAMPFSS